MIKEKYHWYISITTLILSVILIFTMSNFVTTSRSNNENIEELELVLDKNIITDINIDISESDWQWLMDNASNEEYKSCNVTINGETYYNVGIRPKGNSSLSTVVSSDETDRYSFKLKFDKYVDGQTYKGMESIVLNNMIEDNTYMKEYISYDLYDYMGIAVPEMSYSNIKVNGEEWEFYLAIEVIDERYLENNFGTKEGNLYKPETMGMGGKNDNKGGGNPPPKGDNPPDNGEMPPDMNNNNEFKNKDISKMNKDDMRGGPNSNKNSEGADFVYIDDDVSSYSIVRDSAVFKRTTDSDFKKVINMYKNLNDGTNLEDVLDVEEVLKYFAVNTYLVNLDSYSGAMYHNYYLYENNGICQILPWDLNLSFGGFSGMGGKENNSGTSTIINFPIDNPVSGNLENMPLIGKLLEVDEYRELYHSYLKQIADKYFNSGYYANLVNKLDNLIGNYIKEDPTAFCTYEQYETSIPEMITFGEDRTKSILAQLNGEQPSTIYGNIESIINVSALSSKIGGGRGREDKKLESKDENVNSDDLQYQERKINDTNAKDDNSANAEKEKNSDNNENDHSKKEENKISQSKEYLMIVALLCVGITSIFIVSRFKRRKF